MATAFHERTVEHSRKARQCDWCASQIGIGEPYRGYGWRDGSNHGRVSMHLCCYQAMQEMAAEEGGWFEWSLGDFEKGCCCANGDCKCEVSSGS